MLTLGAAANLRAHIQRRASTYIEVARGVAEAANAVRSLKPLLGKGDTEKSGSTLIALGVALIAFPDPTISDVLGTAFIALGLLKKKMRKIGVRDVYEEMRQTASYIKEADEQMLLKRLSTL